VLFDSKSTRHQILLPDQPNPDCRDTSSAGRGLRVAMHPCVRYAPSSDDLPSLGLHQLPEKRPGSGRFNVTPTRLAWLLFEQHRALPFGPPEVVKLHNAQDDGHETGASSSSGSWNGPHAGGRSR
jgi:hypothetical protein